ncbi:Kinesin-like protein NACK2 [Acorus calamus]|uniref:Kinesin-like protein n=1 Tax=Acorus calamus TaxID=4465 RepID=A0AAV9E4G9_ACOCL|nr:Kinesin-like protein NACK2 [Acorus calamus]
MASRQAPKSKKSTALRPSKAVGGGDGVANSPSSSTASIDCQGSPVSSSVRVRSQPHPFEERSKENVTVTVRFRPLSPREIRQGEEIAWYADGDTVVRSEHNPSIAYAYDRVFGPTTTTRHVYDVAAQHVVSGAMEGVNGTIFAYGVTSSGKTHTMQGDQRSPGVIPLAVKDAFSIIQETIESSPCGEYGDGEAVNLSQLNLIDLAGSESSKAETTGLRRKEGSYINKSLLTLGTVIAKLTDGKATHIPYRDSKLTRLLQSSLSGQGRVSLICTVTPSSSNSEETHNTMKFAHRAKHIEIQASQNKIIDEKSLIKKYQNEIRSLREELEQLKRGIVTITPLKDVGDDDIVILKQKLEDGQVKLQSRLEQEEEAKAALLERIQRNTVIKFSSTSFFAQKTFFWGRGARLFAIQKKRLIIDNESVDLYVSMEGYGETVDDTSKEEKRGRKHGLLNWFKLRKRDSGGATLISSDGEKSSGIKSVTPHSIPQAESINCPTEPRNSNSLISEGTPSADILSEIACDKDVQDDSFSAQETPTVSIKSVDHVDLLKEQLKILSGEVALHSSALKRLTEEAASNPEKEEIHIEMRRINDEIQVKNQQIASLEKQMADSFPVTPNKVDQLGLSPSYADLMAQLNEKSFELETSECEALQDTIASLKQQLADAPESKDSDTMQHSSGGTDTKVEQYPSKEELLRQAQAFEIEELKQKLSEVTESKKYLENRNQKLAEECTYAKGLASAAAVELKALSEEVAKLMNDNERLTAELAASTKSSTQRRTNSGPRNINRRDINGRRQDQLGSLSVVRKEATSTNHDRERALETALMEKNQREAELEKKADELRQQEMELHKKVEESSQREAYLENELANMWVLVAKLKRSQGIDQENGV